MFANSPALTFEVTLRATTFEDFRAEVVKLYTQLHTVARLAASPVEGGKPAISLDDKPAETALERQATTARAAPPAETLAQARVVADTAAQGVAEGAAAPGKRGPGRPADPEKAAAKAAKEAAKAAAKAAPPKDRIFAEETAPADAAEEQPSLLPPETHYTDDMPTPALFLRLRAHAKEYHDENGPEKLKAVYAKLSVAGVSTIENDRPKILEVLKHIDNLLGTDPETGEIPPADAGTEDLL